MKTYLFIVPDGEGGWQVGTRGGRVVTTTEPNHFGGEMPIVVAGDIFLKTIPNEDILGGIEVPPSL